MTVAGHSMVQDCASVLLYITNNEDAQTDLSFGA